MYSFTQSADGLSMLIVSLSSPKILFTSQSFTNFLLKSSCIVKAVSVSGKWTVLNVPSKLDRMGITLFAKWLVNESPQAIKIFASVSCGQEWNRVFTTWKMGPLSSQEAGGFCSCAMTWAAPELAKGSYRASPFFGPFDHTSSFHCSDFGLCSC